jgi:mannose-6-phosphate isomerase-like protein (cupin superfamily)
MSAVSLPALPDVLAPDGSEVRFLASASTGSMAEFRLPPGAIAKAIMHKSVTELWYVVAGQGRIWRRSGEGESEIILKPGQSLAIAPQCHFQFRCDGEEPLRIIGVTMPPWPGDEEAVFVSGKW